MTEGMTHTAFSLRHRLALSLSALAAGLMTSAPATAGTDMVQVAVLPGWIAEDGSHMAALHVTLAPGWKTYWRAPGDAGIPPSIDWRGSDNLSDVALIWPTPEVFNQNGLRSVGYDEELVLPMRIKPRDAGQPVKLAAQMQIGVCNTICVPLEFTFALDLPSSGSDPQARKIRSALSDQPVSAAKARVDRVACSIAPISDGLGLTVEIAMPSTGGTETVLVETADPQVWVAETNTTRQGNTLIARTELVHASGGAFALDRSGLRLTVLGANHAVDIRGCTSD